MPECGEGEAEAKFFEIGDINTISQSTSTQAECYFQNHNFSECCSRDVLKSSLLIWSTDVRSTRLYGHFLTGPIHRTLILISNPDIRSARLYSQFPLDKTLTLQVGAIVLGSPSDLNTGNGTEGAMVCTSLGSLLRPLFYFLCSNLKTNPVDVICVNCHACTELKGI